MKLPGRLAALRERNFRLFFIGQATSQLGTGMVPVALSWAVVELTGSVSDLGLVLAAQTVPLVLFLLVGGTVADRLPRRAVMLVSDSARCVTQGLLAALLITGRLLRRRPRCGRVDLADAEAAASDARRAQCDDL